MMISTFANYQNLLSEISQNKKLLAILIDPEKFDSTSCKAFISRIPKETTHLFIGGSTVPKNVTKALVAQLKRTTRLPIFIFPGDADQICFNADALLFLSLLSGNNPEYLIGQQVEAAAKLKNQSLEIIATGYLLIDGGTESAVARVTNTSPLLQNNVDLIVHTALAGALMGAKVIYLEAGSGAKTPVSEKIISEVKKALKIPLIVGGGVRTTAQLEEAYSAGADMVVMGTVFEKK
ncbi:geranylgeranylglyceryl/heptaprenylglyceryl phosphate synthase [Patiriisocius sp. Uisw_017]|jgi:phosphoglycerol geranylgeranyltransferase|uniref:geranylgeranylglyceryl/heptaprenylglyceryl phosphate synthase n=1 Tax=Patiriisocius sp. Uisw_017 TaxID=3230968 RepID=UPI0039E8E9F9